jgi:hypothetical protein
MGSSFVGLVIYGLRGSAFMVLGSNDMNNVKIPDDYSL